MDIEVDNDRKRLELLAESDSGKFGEPFHHYPGHPPRRAEIVLGPDNRPWAAWSYLREDGDFMPNPDRPDATGLLDDFINLSPASSKRVLAFIRKWGPLFICEHGLPDSHSHNHVCKPIGWHSEPRPPKGFMAWEPVETIKTYAGLLKGLLLLGMGLRDGERGERSRWLGLYEHFPYEYGLQQAVPPDPIQTSRGFEGCSLEGLGFLVATFVSQLQIIAPMTFGFSWWSRGPENRLGFSSPLSAAVHQLAEQLAGRGGLSICQSCNKPYRPKRKPRHDRRHYCPSCGRRAAWRESKRRSRHPVSARACRSG